jgi:hypothetical protein
MPIGPKMAQMINTMPAIQRRRVLFIIAPLSKAREVVLIEGCGKFRSILNITQLGSGYTGFLLYAHPTSHIVDVLTDRPFGRQKWGKRALGTLTDHGVLHRVLGVAPWLAGGFPQANLGESRNHGCRFFDDLDIHAGRFPCQYSVTRAQDQCRRASQS